MTEAPSSPEAERAVLGAALVSVDSLRVAAEIVTPADFYKPSHQIIWQAFLDLDSTGERPDPVRVSSLLRERGLLDQVGGITYLAELQNDVPSFSNARHYAQDVAEKAVLRRLAAAMENLRADCYTLRDPAEVLDGLRALASEVELPGNNTLPEDAMSLDEWLARPKTRPDWVVHGLLRRGWRAVLVAGEGVGKSWVSNQIAVAASQGVHPFGFHPIRPINSLIVDAENPEDAIDARAERMIGQARKVTREKYRSHACWIWHRPGGLNLRSRKDRGQFETVLRHVKPELVVFGPLYKSFRKKPNEDHEDVAIEVQQVFDDLRTRYGFALVIEAHAPHGLTAASRELRVRNSAAWQGWPEFGFGLRVDDNTGSLTVERFRGDRVVAWWPDRLDRGREWPWTGVWPDNRWQEAA